MDQQALEHQVRLAKAFPRDIGKFMKAVESMATVTEAVAEDCIVTFAREDRRTGEVTWTVGPSIRLAEMVAACWGNCRTAGRVLEEGPKSVAAVGEFHDLETNAVLSMEVSRGFGRGYSPEVMASASNAAVAISIRNSITRGVPRALWEAAFQAAVRMVAGDPATLGARRADLFDRFQQIGVPADAVLARMVLRSEEDVNLDTYVILRGLFAAIRDGDTTVDDTFPVQPEKKPETDPAAGVAGLKRVLADKPEDQVSRPASVSMSASAPTPAAAQPPAAAGAAESIGPTPEPAKPADAPVAKQKRSKGQG